MVWVAKEDRAEPRAVTTGLEGPERVEIAQGLTGDERVIVAGHDGLYAGARVRDVSGAAPAPREAAETPEPMPEMPGMKGSEPPAKPKESPHAGH